jgi:hypothetical protein
MMRRALYREALVFCKNYKVTTGDGFLATEGFMVDKVVPIRRREGVQKSDADLLLEVRERVVMLRNPIAKQHLKEALKRATLTLV